MKQLIAVSSKCGDYKFTCFACPPILIANCHLDLASNY